MMQFTLVCCTTEGDQVVCHGYTRFEVAKAEMLSRIERMRRDAASTQYRKFIMVATLGHTDGVHVYDADGNPRLERFI